MEQIFMIEVFVKRIVLKVVPPEKDEYELKIEEEEKKKEAEKLAALAAAAKGKKEPKVKKGKEPPPPSEEELKFMASCTIQVLCLPLFDFYIAHDNFVAPPPPPPPAKGKKAPPKPKKGKPEKRELPSEPLPEPPYFGVGNSIIFLSRPSKLEEFLRKTPLFCCVWNRDENLQCTGYCTIEWHESFFDCINQSGEINPVNMDQALFRSTRKPEMVSNTIELVRPLQCEEDLKASGEVELLIRLTCLGNRIVSTFVSLPEMERVPGRIYLNDESKLKDVEVVRHWEGTLISDALPVAYFYQAPDITRAPLKPVEVKKEYSEFVLKYTRSEREILEMGFPQGYCDGVSCPKRIVLKGNQQSFIKAEPTKEKKRKCTHGALPMKPRAYICNEGAYQTCRPPCPKDYL